MQATIHNSNTNKSLVLQKKHKHKQTRGWGEERQTGTHCRPRGICKYTTQFNNTRQEYKSTQLNKTITTQADREVERMATTSTHRRQQGRCNHTSQSNKATQFKWANKVRTSTDAQAPWGKNRPKEPASQQQQQVGCTRQPDQYLQQGQCQLANTVASYVCSKQSDWAMSRVN